MDNLFEFDINPEEMLEGNQNQADDNSDDIVDNIDNNKNVDNDEDEYKIDTTDVNSDEEDESAVKYFYDFVVENGIIDEIQDFDGSIETLKKEIEDLPFKSFKRAVNTLPEISQKLVNYVFAKEDVTLEDIKSFLDDDLSSTVDMVNIQDTESARSFLQQQYTKMNIYSDTDDMEEAIDLLEERGTLIKTAKQLADKVNNEVRRELDAKLEMAEKEKQARIQAAKEENERFINGINTQLEELPWSNTRKQAVIENLKPDIIQKKNEMIRQSPKAIVQLADLYSYFDEKKGEFDFRKLIDDKATSKQNVEKKTRMQEDKFSSAVAALGKQLPSRKEKSILEVVDFDYNE